MRSGLPVKASGDQAVQAAGAGEGGAADGDGEPRRDAEQRLCGEGQ
jgi:hypothetical protein